VDGPIFISVGFDDTCAFKISIHSGISPAVGFNASPGSTISYDYQLRTGVSEKRKGCKRKK
jgi:hypothetical protein